VSSARDLTRASSAVDKKNQQDRTQVVALLEAAQKGVQKFSTPDKGTASDGILMLIAAHNDAAPRQLAAVSGSLIGDRLRLERAFVTGFSRWHFG
jgi:hypothetical protein